MKRIDTHHHLWRYQENDYPWMADDMTVLKRDYLPEDLSVVTKRNSIDGTIVVQARQKLEETDWLLELADNYPFIQGVVGWAPLIDREVKDLIAPRLNNPKLKGMRHVLHDEEDPEYGLRPDFQAGIRSLTELDLLYELLIFHTHLPATIELVRNHPNQRFVVDHIAKPAIAAGELEPWASNLALLAEMENVWCKVSGVVTEADHDGWTESELDPYLDTVFRVFGPERLMFGSDWPVCLLAGSYDRWVKAVDTYLSRYSLDEQEAFWHGTAELVYRLDASS